MFPTRSTHTHTHTHAHAHTHTAVFATCRAPNSIISSSVQSMSSSRMAQRACSYSWVRRTTSYCTDRERVKSKGECTNAHTYHICKHNTHTPWVLYHRRHRIWSEARLCHFLGCPAASGNGTSSTTCEGKRISTCLHIYMLHTFISYILKWFYWGFDQYWTI